MAVRPQDALYHTIFPLRLPDVFLSADKESYEWENRFFGGLHLWKDVVH
jgi:hypothetical protein